MAMILVVEPESQVSEVLRRLLEYAGHTAVCASKPADGEKLYRDQHFDLVIGDGQPNVSWMGHLHEEGQQVLVVSSNITSGLPTLIKPFTMHNLFERVSHLLTSA